MKLDLSNRGLTSLDGIDLTGVTELNCSDNLLTSLPDLSDLHSLEVLYCGYNQLTSLPPLPSSLKQLWCNANRLTSLSDLPDLRTLYCDYNQLTSLPPLPSSLIVLRCCNNQLTSLPDLKNLLDLEIFYCQENQLTELPDLPWGVSDWDRTKLRQYNKRCADLGMGQVDRLPELEQWNEVAEKHLIWQYRIGGEKWAKACSSLT